MKFQTLFTLSGLVASIQAVNICLVPKNDEGCNQALAVACCGNIPNNVCCYFDVFADQGIGRLAIGTLPKGAKGQAYDIGATCTQYLGGCGPTGGTGEGCCLGNYDVVAYGNWFYSSSKRSTVSAETTLPNYIRYQVGGVVKAAAIPEGMHGVAAEAFKSGNVTVFESWPEYEGDWQVDLD